MNYLAFKPFLQEFFVNLAKNLTEEDESGTPFLIFKMLKLVTFLLISL